METLMLVNPKRRGKRRLPPRGPGGKFLKRGSKRRRTTKRRSRRRNPIPGTAIMAANPVRRRRRSVARVTRRRRRRNPIGVRGFMGALTAPLMPAVVGAAGAIGNEVAFRFIPLPANLKTGMIGTLSRAVVAVGLGMALDRVMGRKMASQMTAGALTVLAYGQLKGILATAAPQLINEYISDDDMGYYGAGTVLNQIPDSLRDVPNSLSEEYDFSGVGEYISE
jgi:hypothetical protein